MLLQILLVAVVAANTRGDSYGTAHDQQARSLFPKLEVRDLRPRGLTDPNVTFFDQSQTVKGDPVQVRVNAYMLDVSDFDDDSQEYSVTMYLRLFWKDKRLIFNNSQVKEVVIQDPDRAWVPDLFFVNEKKGKRHDVTTENTFFRVKDNGDVSYSARYTLQLSCPMDHSRFPFDKQICGIRIESYGYAMKDMVLLWKDEEEEEPFIVTTEVNAKPFVMKGFGYGYCNTKLKHGEYSCLRAEFLVARMGACRAFLQAYLPLGVLVILAHLSLWCPVKKRSARLCAASLVFLLTVLVAAVVAQLGPDTRDATALDCWAFWCVLLSFLPVVVLAVSACMQRCRETARKRQGYEACSEDPNKTLEMLTPPFIDSDEKGDAEKGDEEGGKLQKSEETPVALAPPCKKPCAFARLGLTVEKFERGASILVLALLLLFVLVHALYYALDTRCHLALDVQRKFAYPLEVSTEVTN